MQIKRRLLALFLMLTLIIPQVMSISAEPLSTSSGSKSNFIFVKGEDWLGINSATSYGGAKLHPELQFIRFTLIINKDTDDYTVKPGMSDLPSEATALIKQNPISLMNSDLFEKYEDMRDSDYTFSSQIRQPTNPKYRTSDRLHSLNDRMKYTQAMAQFTGVSASTETDYPISYASRAIGGTFTLDFENTDAGFFYTQTVEPIPNQVIPPLYGGITAYTKMKQETTSKPQWASASNQQYFLEATQECFEPEGLSTGAIPAFSYAILASMMGVDASERYTNENVKKVFDALLADGQCSILAEPVMVYENENWNKPLTNGTTEYTSSSSGADNTNTFMKHLFNQSRFIALTAGEVAWISDAASGVEYGMTTPEMNDRGFVTDSKGATITPTAKYLTWEYWKQLFGAWDTDYNFLLQSPIFAQSMDHFGQSLLLAHEEPDQKLLSWYDGTYIKYLDYMKTALNLRSDIGAPSRTDTDSKSRNTYFWKNGQPNTAIFGKGLKGEPGALIDTVFYTSSIAKLAGRHYFTGNNPVLHGPRVGTSASAAKDTSLSECRAANPSNPNWAVGVAYDMSSYILCTESELKGMPVGPTHAGDVDTPLRAYKNYSGSGTVPNSPFKCSTSISGVNVWDCAAMMNFGAIGILHPQSVDTVDYQVNTLEGKGEQTGEISVNTSNGKITYPIYRDAYDTEKNSITFKATTSINTEGTSWMDKVIKADTASALDSIGAPNNIANYPTDTDLADVTNFATGKYAIPAKAVSKIECVYVDAQGKECDMTYKVYTGSNEYVEPTIPAGRPISALPQEIDKTNNSLPPTSANKMAELYMTNAHYYTIENLPDGTQTSEEHPFTIAEASADGDTLTQTVPNPDKKDTSKPTVNVFNDSESDKGYITLQMPEQVYIPLDARYVKVRCTINLEDQYLHNQTDPKILTRPSQILNKSGSEPPFFTRLATYINTEDGTNTPTEFGNVELDYSNNMKEILIPIETYDMQVDRVQPVPYYTMGGGISDSVVNDIKVTNNCSYTQLVAMAYAAKKTGYNLNSVILKSAVDPEDVMEAVRKDIDQSQILKSAPTPSGTDAIVMNVLQGTGALVSEQIYHADGADVQVRSIAAQESDTVVATTDTEAAALADVMGTEGVDYGVPDPLDYCEYTYPSTSQLVAAVNNQRKLTEDPIYVFSWLTINTGVNTTQTPSFETIWINNIGAGITEISSGYTDTTPPSTYELTCQVDLTVGNKKLTEFKKPTNLSTSQITEVEKHGLTEARLGGVPSTCSYGACLVVQNVPNECITGKRTSVQYVKGRPIITYVCKKSTGKHWYDAPFWRPKGEDALPRMYKWKYLDYDDRDKKFFINSQICIACYETGEHSKSHSHGEYSDTAKCWYNTYQLSDTQPAEFHLVFDHNYNQAQANSGIFSLQSLEGVQGSDKGKYYYLAEAGSFFSINQRTRMISDFPKNNTNITWSAVAYHPGLSSSSGGKYLMNTYISKTLLDRIDSTGDTTTTNSFLTDTEPLATELTSPKTNWESSDKAYALLFEPSLDKINRLTDLDRGAYLKVYSSRSSSPKYRVNYPNGQATSSVGNFRYLGGSYDSIDDITDREDKCNLPMPINTRGGTDTYRFSYNPTKYASLSDVLTVSYVRFAPAYDKAYGSRVASSTTDESFYGSTIPTTKTFIPKDYPDSIKVDKSGRPLANKGLAKVFMGTPTSYEKALGYVGYRVNVLTLIKDISIYGSKPYVDGVLYSPTTIASSKLIGDCTTFSLVIVGTTANSVATTGNPNP